MTPHLRQMCEFKTDKENALWYRERKRRKNEKIFFIKFFEELNFFVSPLIPLVYKIDM